MICRPCTDTLFLLLLKSTADFQKVHVFSLPPSNFLPPSLFYTHTHMCPHIHSLLHVCTPHTLFHVHTLLPSSPMQYRSLFSSTPKPISLESVVIDESNSLRSAVVPNPEYYYSAKSCINLGDHLSQRRTHSFPFSAPRNADPICSWEPGSRILCAVMVFWINHTSLHFACVGLAFCPAGAVGTVDRDTVIFALQGSGQQPPSFGAWGSLSHHPDPQWIWLSVFPLGWGVGAWGGVGAGGDVVLALPGTVSQNYIFMLATTV